MKIVIIDEQQFDNYAKTHEYSSYYQSSSYGKLMNNHGLKPMYLGFYDKDKLIGASLILSKPSFMGFKYGYAPRGLLIDYNNYNQIIELAKDLKNFLFKERFILLKIDPLILISKRDKDGNVVYENTHRDNIIETFKSAGFHHCGFNRAFESVKPRWLAYLDLQNDEDNLFKNLTKQTRNKIRKAMKLGVEVYQDNDAITKIYPFIARKGNYSLKYYQEFSELFSNNLEIYVAKINTEKYVEGSRLLYEKELEYNEYLNNIISRDGYKGKDMKDILSKKMESDKLLIIYKDYLVNSITLLRNNPEGIIIGGTIIVKEEDTIHLLIDGYDKTYSKFCPLYLTKWEIIKKYLNSDFKYFDINAVTGIFDKNEENAYRGLNEMKLGFNTTIYEYIGEFNLIINNPIYALYKNIVIDDSIKNIAK